MQPQLSEFEQLVQAQEFDRACAVLLSIDDPYLSLWGHYSTARDMYLQVLDKLTDQELTGFSLGNLGNAYRSQGNYDQAIKQYRQALVIAREIGDRRNEGAFLGNLGNAYGSLGEYDKALACLIPSLQIRGSMKSPDASWVVSKLQDLREKHPDFEDLLRSLFPGGDTVLNEATGQDYAFYQNAPEDLPEQILALLASFEE